MIKFIQYALIFFLCASTLYTQTSKIFYSGKGFPEGMRTYMYGFSKMPEEAADMGYTPGTPAFKWGTESPELNFQGLLFGYDNTLDLSGEWESGSVHFKLRAPNGVNPQDNLEIWLYDSWIWDWDYAVKYDLGGEEYQVLNDGQWHQFSIPYNVFETNVNEIDKTDFYGLSFETYLNLISYELYIDDVWVGNPDVNFNMTLFNGKDLPFGVTGERNGFEDNDFEIAEGEGFADSTNAVVWENNISANDNSGIFFTFNTQDFSSARLNSTLHYKIKAPAGTDDLVLKWWDNANTAASYTLSGNAWNGEWVADTVDISEFSANGINWNSINKFSIGPAGSPISSRILFDDIWVSDTLYGPPIDITSPPAPEELKVDVITDNLSNIISWKNIESESGETYNIYRSFDPITSLTDSGVINLALAYPEGLDETIEFTHWIYYPMDSNTVSYYYAVETVDASGNISKSFSTVDGASTNTGFPTSIIHIESSAFNFIADGNLSEWDHIVPYDMLPYRERVRETIDGSSDYSAEVKVAMNEDNIYVAVNVVDDVFVSGGDSANAAWKYDVIELFFGLYELKNMHYYFQRGDEPDYRVVFKPDRMEFLNGTSYESGTEFYHFESLPDSNYVLEAKIPFSSIRFEGDADFTPREGIEIPFEIFSTDVDLPGSDPDGWLQLGDSYLHNPWGDGPKGWAYAWIGMPLFTDVEDGIQIPYEFSLENNYPNPFNPSTTINFTLTKTADANLVVYNSLGQKVATLVDGKMHAGNHSVVWNGQDASGRLAASGVYFYRLVSGKMMQTKKMILLK